MLYRKIQPFIEGYLKADSNKVLIIDGARQIGKTCKITGKDIQCIYINKKEVHRYADSD